MWVIMVNQVPLIFPVSAATQRKLAPGSTARAFRSPFIVRWLPSTAHRSLSPACILRHLSQNRSEGSRHMEESAKLASLPFLGEAEPVPQSLFLSFPEQA